MMSVRVKVRVRIIPPSCVCTPTRRMICNLFNTQSWMTASLVECVSLTMVRVRNLVWSDGCETSCVFV